MTVFIYSALAGWALALGLTIFGDFFFDWLHNWRTRPTLPTDGRNYTQVFRTPFDVD